jgi:hypothetical protein
VISRAPEDFQYLQQFLLDGQRVSAFRVDKHNSKKPNFFVLSTQLYKGVNVVKDTSIINPVYQTDGRLNTSRTILAPPSS